MTASGRRTPGPVLPRLPVPRTATPRTRLGRWFVHGRQLDEPQHESAQPWHRVLWLTGVDYFSTLGYQPGIALLAAGALSPIATALLVAVTLLGALPVYSQVARRSYAGQGSIAMLENLLPGWIGKFFVLVLLAFAATDFVITMTLSAADAAQHAVENPFLHPSLGDHRLLVTLVLLALLASVFLTGLREAIGLAMAVAVPYLILNVVVIVRGFFEILRHPDLIGHWRIELLARGDWTALLITSSLIFPKLALGMSGFETGVAVMPLISPSGSDAARPSPSGVVAATRRLLLTAAMIMSALLLASSFVTTLLIPEPAFADGGAASGRAIAYLAHQMLGSTLGSVYDAATIAILWFAGASAMTGLLNLIPRYLPRFGMAPRWTSYARPLVATLLAVDFLITFIFDADVEAQGGAYATGVLALMLSAAVAVALAFWREAGGSPAGPDPADAAGTGADSAALEPNTTRRSRWLSLYFWLVAAIFAFILVDNVIERTDGVVIAGGFIVAILLLSAISRYRRSKELRVSELTFVDDESANFWEMLAGRKVNAVPLRFFDASARRRKLEEIRRYYQVSAPVAFIHVHLIDNRSEFLSPLQVKVRAENGHYLVEVFGAVAVANTIAYISELIDPISLFLGLTRQNLMVQSLKYLFWGEGEIGLTVYAILVRYWHWTPEEDTRPLIFLMSE
ncbi:MAG: hypothetical protein HY315_00865 [Acidobacteria bacterium]|nr:hypothetical protein [Acidobacteriota bacterium]